MAKWAVAPEDVLPLSPAVFSILIALAGGDRHGYAIMQEVGFKADGSPKLGPGTLYSAIRRLLDDGLIEESPPRPDVVPGDERRRYYRLTAYGRAVAAAEADRLALLVQRARRSRLLSGPNPAGTRP